MQSIPLAELGRGESAQVSGLATSQAFDDRSEDPAALLARLRDLGFVAGARCQVIARMWLGGDPLVVRIGGSTFALRRAEAAAIRVLRQQERPCPSAALEPKDASAAAV
jgi:ferrous iron transport protein A